MIDREILLLFLPAAIALNMTPGADMLFCLGQGMKNGPLAGLAASFGVSTGCLVHTLAAAFGLAAFINAWPLAFEIIRWAGVAYLVWLAAKVLFFDQSDAHRPDEAHATTALAVATATNGKNTIWTAWRDGMIVNLFNPKVILFILAFLPQFVDPAKGAPTIQFLILGMVLIIGGTIINGVVGLFAGQLGKSLFSNPVYKRRLEVFTAIIFLGLATRLAMQQR